MKRLIFISIILILTKQIYESTSSSYLISQLAFLTALVHIFLLYFDLPSFQQSRYTEQSIHIGLLVLLKWHINTYCNWPTLFASFTNLSLTLRNALWVFFQYDLESTFNSFFKRTFILTNLSNSFRLSLISLIDLPIFCFGVIDSSLRYSWYFPSWTFVYPPACAIFFFFSLSYLRPP